MKFFESIKGNLINIDDVLYFDGDIAITKDYCRYAAIDRNKAMKLSHFVQFGGKMVNKANMGKVSCVLIGNQVSVAVEIRGEYLTNTLERKKFEQFKKSILSNQRAVTKVSKAK